MRFKAMLSLILVLGLCGIGSAQQHEGHGSARPPGVDRGQTRQASPRALSDLVKDAEGGLEPIKHSITSNDAESLDRATNSYVSILSEIRDAMKQGDPDSRDFDRDLARVEKMSRTNLETLRDMRRSAPANALGGLDDAAAATRETYVAATDLRDEIAGADGSHHGGRAGRGSCGYGYGCGQRGHHGSWLSRWWRGC